ncbi:methionyl-tRNA formyltransferase [Planctomycetaceae bacterium]|nr:methionyl-tRNA formyltransferase [Planctomycetaceae bacterium]
MPIRVIFFGTPAIAVPSLQSLAQSRELQLVGVFTQPAARRSRRGQAEPSEVALAARALSLETHEVESVNEGAAFERLRELAPDAIAVVSFGQILKKRVLELPRHGCINFHPSMLPAFRGAAPIQRAVIAGVRMSGLTIMRLVKRLDAGPILAQQPWEIGETLTAEELMAQAATLGAAMMRDTLERLARGEQVVAREQDDAKATLAPPLLKEDGMLDFRRDAVALRDLVRGVQPWPRAQATLAGEKPRRVIVHGAQTREGKGAAGEIVAFDKGGILVACGEGALCLTQVQLEGKSVVSGFELANGLRLARGARFVLPENA